MQTYYFKKIRFDYFLIIFNLVLCSVFSQAHAEVPLDIEGLLTKKGVFRLENSITYSQNESDRYLTDQPLLIQTGENSYVYVPTNLSTQNSQQDTLVYGLNLRYGLTARTELYARASYIYNQSRYQTGTEQKSQSNRQFQDMWLGTNFRIMKEGDYPALLMFADIQATQKLTDKSVYGKAYTLGLTSYRTIDPLVLSISLAYLGARAYETQGATVKTGQVWNITPQVSFAVNEKATLQFGLTWRNQWASKRDGIANSLRKTSTAISLGLGYALTDQHSISGFVRQNNTNRGAEMGISWQMEWGGAMRQAKQSKQIDPAQ
jgi:hypothetical protein